MLVISPYLTSLLYCDIKEREDIDLENPKMCLKTLEIPFDLSGTMYRFVGFV